MKKFDQSFDQRGFTSEGSGLLPVYIPKITKSNLNILKISIPFSFQLLYPFSIELFFQNIKLSYSVLKGCLEIGLIFNCSACISYFRHWVYWTKGF